MDKKAPPPAPAKEDELGSPKQQLRSSSFLNATHKSLSPDAALGAAASASQQVPVSEFSTYLSISTAKFGKAQQPVEAVYRSLKAVDRTASSFARVPESGSFSTIQQKDGKNSVKAPEELMRPKVQTSDNVPPQCDEDERSPTCSDITCETVAEAKTTVDNGLICVQADAMYNEAEFKWKCTSYSENRRLSFRVYLFSSSKKNIFVIDFQRREGCAFHFASLLNEMKYHLAKAGALCESTGVKITASKELPQPARAFCAPPLPDDLAEDLPAPDTSCFQPLLQMADSSFADVQKEGVREIANLAGKEVSRSVLGGMSKLYDILAKLMHSADEDLVRCAAACIHSLAKTTEFHKSIVETEQSSIVRQLVSIALQSDSAFSFETRRLCAVSIAQLCNGEFKQFVMQSAGENFLDMLQATEDKRLKNYVHEAQIITNVH